MVYLDNAATTQKPLVVLERLQRFYSYENSNIHRGIYQLADGATLEYENARNRVGKFINSHSPGDVVFCRGTTEAINMVAQGLRKYITPEHQVLVTAMEHHANFVPWQTVCNQTGASFRVVSVKPDGTLDWDQLRTAIRQKPLVLAITHISNTLGIINPIQEIIALAKDNGVITVVDAAQSIAYGPLDVKDLGCDFLAFSGHKAFGPMGIGVLYGKEEQIARLEPYQQGGSMIVKVSEESTTFKPPPYGLEAGTPAVAEAIALGTALEFISGIGLTNIRQHSHSILLYARQELASLQGVQQIGPESGTSNIISFLLKDIHPHDVATILDESGVAVRAGHHCTQPLMQALNIHGTVRASFSIYNDRDDVDYLIDALKTVKKIML
jgi:cysteine desulfurase/selenocysteine lyase